MSWVTPTSRATSFLVTAAVWNQDVVDNVKYLKGQAGTVVLEDYLQINQDSRALLLGATPWARIRWTAAAIVEVRNGADTDYAVLRSAKGTGSNDLVPNSMFVNGAAYQASQNTTSTSFTDVTSGSVTLTCPVAGTILAVMGGSASLVQGVAVLHIDGNDGVEMDTNFGIGQVLRTQVAAGARVVKMRIRSSDGTDVNFSNLYMWCLFVPYQAAA